MEIVGRLASQAPSKEHHSLSEGQPELVEPSPVYILKTSPRPPELAELEDELEVEVGAAAEEDGACEKEVGLATLAEVVSGAYVGAAASMEDELGAA